MSGRLFLCTDLDGTLLPNSRESQSPVARRRFARLAAREEVTLAYVSGRDLGLVEEAVAEYSLPVPQFVIADVGASIYEATDGTWQAVESWSTKLAGEWKNGTARRVASLLENMSGLRAQQAASQAEFKVSYFVEESGSAPETLAQVESRLHNGRVPARSIFSHDLRGTGLLDLLPPSAGKLSAIEFVAAGMSLGPRGIVFSGDSGNDMEVLASGWPSVLVANATSVVKAQARELAASRGNGEMLYIAKGDFLGMNGNYAAGILEGVAHFRPECVEWMI